MRDVVSHWEGGFYRQRHNDPHSDRQKIKKEAAQTLEDILLSVSDAVQVFLKRIVANKQLPFELKAPNATTRRAMTVDEIVQAKRVRRKL